VSDEYEGDECPICDKLGCEGHTLVEGTYVDGLTAERDKLRAALKALCEALPKCDSNPYVLPRRCRNVATVEFVTPDMTLYFCDEHRDQEKPDRILRHLRDAPWAIPARAALRLLGEK